MRRGFTLIELIIVIALIALVGGLMVVNAEAILGGLGDEPAERTLQKAIREARFQAASLKAPAILRYDEETALLEISTDTGQDLVSFSTGSTEDAPEITFEQILPGPNGMQPFNLSFRTQMYVVSLSPSVSLCTCIHIYMYIYKYTYMYVYIHIMFFTCVYTCIHNMIYYI